MSWLFTSGGQSTRASASAPILPKNIEGWFPLRLTAFDLPAVQGTLKSLFQHHSLKASILWCLAFFMVQLSQLYVTTRKTITLTIWTFVSKVMSLLFNTLSRFVIASLPRSKHFRFEKLKGQCCHSGVREEKVCTRWSWNKGRGWTYMAWWLMLVSLGFTPFAVERSERVLGKGMTWLWSDFCKIPLAVV